MSEIIKITRQLSQRAVMEAIIQCAPISRASISKQTGLSKQTVSEVMRDLESDGWVRETGRTSGHVGRTAINYELVPDAAYILSVDLGGTKVRVAICNLACEISAEEVAPTVAAGGQAVVAQIASLCWKAVDSKAIPRDRIKLAIVGVPGAPDNSTGRVLLAPNIPHFDTMDVAGALEKALGFGVILENDVNLAVVGENWLGEGQGIDNLAYVAVGTGIGSGLMVNGALVRGALHAAGELGFLPFGADPFEEESLRTGAFERVVASVGIRNSYRERTGEEIPVPAIFERASAGEAHAAALLDDVAKYLARGIGAIAAIANPQKVIIGGSIGLRPELVDRVKRFLPACFPYPVDIGVSSLGAWAAIIGGAAIGLEHLHNTLFGTETPDRRLTLPPSEAVTFREHANA
ncbi:ROK family transcriptional regulator (plasmid) [Rhizobium sp. NIBRBAC000502774]|nr:ROK family transcriptional regulator [Rhizobium sp. NIBRBAC000502774]